MPGGSSPHASSSKCSSIVPAPRPYSTNLLDLPIEVHEKIFSYLGFKTVSQMRMVNRQFNTICSSVLNSTFQRLQNQMLHRFQAIKAKMPRRESARRSHPLACESDIIETLHMRLSLLQMTFGKHIERKHCCFFPGEILDEVYSILAYLKTTTKLARPYKVTDELFDLTTMAMEYFKEHIEPNLPEITYFGTDFFDITTAFSPGESSKSYMCLDSPPPSGFEAQQQAGPSTSERRGSALNSYSYMEESLPPSPPPPQSNMVLRKRIHRIKQGMKNYSYMEESLPPSPPPPQSNMVLRKRIHRIKQGMKNYSYMEESLPPSPPPPQSNMVLRKRIHRIKQGMKKYNDQLASLRSDLRGYSRQKQIAEQQKQTLEYATRLDDYDKKNEETSRKFQTLLQAGRLRQEERGDQPEVSNSTSGLLPHTSPYIVIHCWMWKQIAEQQKQTLEYATRLDDYDKKNEETSRKFQTLLQISEQQKQIAEQQNQTLEYATRLDDYDKKNEETSRKFQTLLQVCCPIH
ncbi:f-box domain-containing protein [Phthorimaea operculella]|nr:f-box domain-containing protein [Phthorimaea operculella]